MNWIPTGGGAPLAATTVLFRCGEQLESAFLLRTDLAIGSDGQLRCIVPDDAAENRCGAFDHRLTLLPCGHGAALLLKGTSHGEGEDGAENTVRATLFREDKALIEWEQQRAPGVPISLGPSDGQGSNAALLDALQSQSAAGVIALSEASDHPSWRLAPMERQFEGAAGGERLLLEGWHSDHSCLVFGLPRLSAELTLKVQGEAHHFSFAMALVMLDVDMGKGAVVWRCSLPVTDPWSLATVELQARLDKAPRSVRKAGDTNRPAAGSPPQPAPETSDESHIEAMAAQQEALAAKRREAKERNERAAERFAKEQAEARQAEAKRQAELKKRKDEERKDNKRAVFATLGRFRRKKK